MFFYLSECENLLSNKTKLSLFILGLGEKEIESWKESKKDEFSKKIKKINIFKEFNKNFDLERSRLYKLLQESNKK